MRLEQNLELYRPTEKTFTLRDLEYLSVTAMYTGDPCDRGLSSLSKMSVKETFREDSHEPYGDHLNYEVWLALKGKKKGRNVLLSNTHVEVNDDSK